ncbi:hypothetical protein DM02DRAFT_706601 [Periconia macrospinosa]|uniref:Methyltransferase n=1 Tax=Periconia macrospinosa TaxID=97972 RepID=A0A2V1DUM9_9PLEO|nr:hypothetical protein DM02DRAFT_706601 [Periconia macrospinosa]
MDEMENYSGHDTIADINYLPATGKIIETSAWKKRYLQERDQFTRAMKIRDIRGMGHKFQLDLNGFEFVQIPTKQRSTDDDEVIIKDYYPELENIIRKMTGASTVFAFNHAIRQASDPSEEGKPDNNGRLQQIPASHPHVDYAAIDTDSGIRELIEGTKKEITFPPHISKLYDTCSRFCFLNVWRPLKTIKKDPLAVADATTVPDSDYQVRARKFRSGIKSANYVMSHGNKDEQHRWYYMYEMQPDEIVIFKGYDTKQDFPGWRCPHTAFVLPGTENSPPRESIECRIVCFWE